MDRYWLIVLINVITWYGYSYGQPIDEKREGAQPIVNTNTPQPSPQSPAIVQVPAQPAQAVSMLPSDTKVLQDSSPKEGQKTQEEKSKVLNDKSIAPAQPTPQPQAQQVVQKPLQPSMSTVVQTVPQPKVEVSAQQIHEPEPKKESEAVEKTQEIEKKAEDGTIKSVPEASSAKPVTLNAEEESLPEIVGIDTVNVESASGNWLLKRIWFERAQEQYEKTKVLFDKVLELRFTFFTKRTELDRTLFDPFYMNIGIGQGELLEIINRLLQDFQEMRNKEGALTVQENILYERVEQEKETLERLQKDVTGVTEIDAAVETAINQLVEQVNVCRNYEKQSWDTFKEIAKQLSDKKARELYYAMDTYRKNSANIVTYLQRDFSNYMQLLERMAHEQIDRIMSAIDQLKKKNVDFKEQAQRLEQKRYVKESASKSTTEQKKVEQEQEESVEQQGIISSVWSVVRDGMATMWQALIAGVYGIYGWIWPHKEEAQTQGNMQATSKKLMQSNVVQ